MKTLNLHAESPPAAPEAPEKTSMSRLLAPLLAAGAVAQNCGTGQARLALTSAADGSEMRVAWATGNTTTPTNYAGVVKYGRTPGALTMTSAIADSRNYTMCDLASVHLHSAVLTGLTAGSTFYYSIVEPRCGATAPVKFTAPRAVGDKASAYPFTVFAYGALQRTRVARESLRRPHPPSPPVHLPAPAPKQVTWASPTRSPPST